MQLYNFQIMLTLLRRTPALLPRASARLLASESARAQKDAEASNPSPATPQQNPLDTRDYFGVFTILYCFPVPNSFGNLGVHNLSNVKMLFDARMHLGHTVRSLNPQMNK